VVRVEQPTSVDEFLERAGAFLGAREAEHNLIFALTGGLTATPELFPEPPRFAVVVDESANVVGAAIQTPPRQLVLSETADSRATGALAAAFADVELPGVLGPTASAEAFARSWATARPGRSVEPGIRERIYRLQTIVPPRSAPGHARIAVEADQDLVLEWLQAFSEEALGEPNDEAALMARRWIDRIGGRAMWLWEVDGEIVSACGVSGPTPHGIRVAPVYTPPVHRGLGYAGNLVAAASQAQLDAGRRFVFLFTDLANPTSNHVYQAIGYEPVADVDQWLFRAQQAAPGARR
jgi:predicted GNAT family acetyltransferase